jgi:hypothetical protein
VPVLPDVIGRERRLRVVVPGTLAEIPRIRAVLDEVRTFLGPARWILKPSSSAA